MKSIFARAKHWYLGGPLPLREETESGGLICRSPDFLGLPLQHASLSRLSASTSDIGGGRLQHINPAVSAHDLLPPTRQSIGRRAIEPRRLVTSTLGLYMRTLIYLSVLLLGGSSFRAIAAPEAERVFLIASRSVVVIETDTGALGSGVAYYSFGDSGTGFLTNCHVLRGATSFTVSHKRQKAIGIFIFGNPEYDLCLIGSKLTLPVVNKRSFFSLRVGEAAYAVGAPRGLELSLTNGIVSQLRGEPLLLPPLLIQTTASISPGSSGGGLFDEEGQLMGITTFFFKESQSLNFAVSINMANGLSEYGKARSLEDLSKPDTRSLLPAPPSDPPPVKIIGFEPDKPKGTERKSTTPPPSAK